MPKGYWIARVDVSDPDHYQGYVKGIQEPFARFGARYLVRGGAHEAPDRVSRSRNVVIEFPSYEAALACYNDAAYQKAKAIRQSAADADILIIEGYDGAQPGN